MRAMGRDCGTPRPPLATLTDTESKVLFTELTGAGTMNSEPRGWV